MARPSVETQRKHQILVSTCQAIAYKGISVLRMADIARAAGLSTGIIHYYFDNKKDLIQAAFRKNFEQYIQYREKISNAEQPPLEKLHQHIDASLPTDDDSIQSWRIWMELWSESLHDEHLKALNNQAYQARRNTILGVVQECVDTGQISVYDAAEATDILVAMLDGLGLQVLADSPSMSPGQMRITAHAFVDRLCR